MYLQRHEQIGNYVLPVDQFLSTYTYTFMHIAVCGVGRKTRIVGGNVTSVYEFPWIVSMSKQGTFYCAGSLITRKHVLTAAHCMEG